MNIAAVLSGARKALQMGALVAGYEDEGRLALRALVNAAGYVGFPMGAAYSLWARHKQDVPALLAELRGNVEIRRWVIDWSNGPPPNAPPKPKRRR